MIEQKNRDIINYLSKYLPSDKLYLVKNSLKDASDNTYESIMKIKFHKPANIALLSIFFGGLALDRFVMGDVGLAFAKLILGITTFGLWWFIDIFCSYKRAREINLNKVLVSII
ncbi:MAG: TM2 domain-containing protein [Clostridia bacterium]|jgi:TM2 domain-containing membrane protein YozV|nr:TM2 domain-containing protein [Clostridia bacterium]MDD4275439.1 TM2 domain-containing protein [Clostridia bacterium]